MEGHVTFFRKALLLLDCVCFILFLRIYMKSKAFTCCSPLSWAGSKMRLWVKLAVDGCWLMYVMFFLWRYVLLFLLRGTICEMDNAKPHIFIYHQLAFLLGGPCHFLMRRNWCLIRWFCGTRDENELHTNVTAFFLLFFRRNFGNMLDRGGFCNRAQGGY